jgi:hypothetical protein
VQQASPELTAVVSLLSYFLCSITVVPSLTVTAQAAWDGRPGGGGGGWRGVVVTSLYDGWYGYPIRLTRIYGYASSYRYGYGYPYAYSHYVHHRSYVAVHSVRRVRDYKSVAAATSGAATTRAAPSATKTVQPASADTASPRNVWTPITVPLSQSPANVPPKSDVGSNEWAKKLELRLNQLSPDMWAASALLEREGFRVDSGNKSATGWFLTAHDRNQHRGSIKLQSDGTKIDLTVAG